MINVHDYFDINWEATSDNIRSLIHDYIPFDTFARAMCVTERTIYNWCNNKSNPPLDKLILMAKIFNVGFFDIVILNGQLEGPIKEQDLIEFKMKAQKSNPRKTLNSLGTQYQFYSEEEVLANILYNEYTQSNSPIINLNDFLLYLPLFDLTQLSNILNRIIDNVGINNKYVNKNLSILYERIPNDKAKEFAEFHKKYILTYPSIEHVKIASKLKLRHDKYIEGLNIIDSEDFKEMYESYLERVENLVTKLRSLDVQ